MTQNLQTTNKAGALRRSRRNFAKAVLMVAGATAAMPVTTKAARADLIGDLLGGLLGGGGTGTGSGGTGGGTGGSTPSGGNCFLRGTRILTADGYRTVEDLAVGDVISTRFGGLRPVKGLQVHSFTKRAGDAWPTAAKPVRVAASALASNVPRADVYMTATHSIFVDGALVPAANLVNGTTIAVVEPQDAAQVEYFHIELDGHDVIDAEGLPCESLLGESKPCAPILTFNGGRQELASRLRSAFSPLVDRRRRLDRIRDRLEERAAA